MLKRFERATKRLEGTADDRTKCGRSSDGGTNRRFGALWQAVDELDYLWTTLESVKLTLDKHQHHLRDGIAMAIQKLAKYFVRMDAESPYYFAVLALHPAKRRT